MAEKHTGDPDEASLELPSLFGRKKKRKGRDGNAAPPGADGQTEGTTAGASGAADETAVVPVVEEPVAPPPAAPPAAPAPTEPTRAPEPEPAPAPVAEEPTRAMPSVEAPPPAPVPEPEPDDEPAPAGGARKARPKRELPPLKASVASLVVGAIVGLLGVGLTFGALQTCDAITGTDSCGGPGLLVVLVVVVVMVMAGSALLRAFGVSEPGGLSFLGVAIFVAICLVFLLQQLLEPWMVVVGPVLCALGYGTANWVVNRFNTELLAEDSPEPHDVR